MKMTHAARHPIRLWSAAAELREVFVHDFVLPEQSAAVLADLAGRRPNDGPLLTAGCAVIDCGFAHHPVVLVGVGDAATAVKGMAWALCDAVSRK
jgi:hypothetical protein